MDKGWLYNSKFGISIINLKKIKKVKAIISVKKKRMNKDKD